MKKEHHKGSLKHKKHSLPKVDQLAVMEGDTINYLKPDLPSNFFELIVSTEIELSEEFSHDKLLKLFELYTKAIQYYAYIDPSKVKPYQNRMEHLLTKKDTLNNLTRFNIERKNTITKEAKEAKETNETNNSNSDNIKKKETKTKLPKIRGRVKTIFKYKAKDINKSEIRKQVREILKDVIILMKIDKKNLRNIINEELAKQRQNFMENLNEKRGLMNYWKNKRKTLYAKNRNNPKKEFRKTIYIKNRGKNGRNVLNFRKTRTMLKDDDSDFDKMANEKEYLHLLNELDGGKGGKSDSDDDSIINDSYEEEDKEDNESN